MKLSLATAKKLLILADGAEIPASNLNRQFTEMLLADGVIIKRHFGRSRAVLRLSDKSSLDIYLRNKFGVRNLKLFIDELENEESSGKTLIEAGSNSKLKNIRRFKGFLVNSYFPFKYVLNGKLGAFNPVEGTFLYVHDFEEFSVDGDYTIIGVENPENFRRISQQKYLFEILNPIFVSRYPHSGDMVKWLARINNPYLHFGDFDLAGIHIYLTEFKRHVLDRGNYFMPDNLAELIREKGNRSLYNDQLHLKNSILKFKDKQIEQLLSLIMENKKGLEQEVFILPKIK